MRNTLTILCFLVILLLSSVCPERPLPDKIPLNAMCVWDTKHDVIELQSGWLQMNMDSLLKDAGIKIQNIKNYD